MTTLPIPSDPLEYSQQREVQAIRNNKDLMQQVADNKNTGSGGWEDPWGLLGVREAAIQDIVTNTPTLQSDGTFNLNLIQRHLYGITDKDVAAAVIDKANAEEYAADPQTFSDAKDLGIQSGQTRSLTDIKRDVGKEQTYRKTRDKLLGEIRLADQGSALLAERGLDVERPAIEALQKLQAELRPLQTDNKQAAERHGLSVKTSKSNLKTQELNRDIAQQQEARARLQQQQSEVRDRNNLAQQNWQNEWTKYTTELNQYNREADKLQRAHELQMARDERKEKNRLDYRLSVMDMEGRKEDREARREDRLAQQRMASIAQLIKGLTHMGAGMAI